MGKFIGSIAWRLLESGMGTDESRERMRAAKANWAAWTIPIQDVFEAAEEWAGMLVGVDKPWLCWSVNREWSMVQQRLVVTAGWTPVVGFDPRAGVPRVHPSGILVDFNKRFNLPALHMVFPLEWVFRYADRLAFWHSDLLARKSTMRVLAERFAALKDGEVAAVDQRVGLIGRLRGRKGRFWELVGCTTRGASRHQYESGAGWWRNIAYHPNCSDDPGEKARRAKYPYDHGAGILYWQRHCGGVVRSIPESLVAEGHCTRINNPLYQRVSPEDERRDLSKDLPHNYDLREVSRRLGVEDLMEPE